MDRLAQARSRIAYFEDLLQPNELPVIGPKGKFGWCRRLPQPAWNWNEIEILQPRTLRLPL